MRMSDGYDNVFEEHETFSVVKSRAEGGEPVPATPHPWSQEEILAAAAASLTQAGIPPDDDDPDG